MTILDHKGGTLEKIERFGDPWHGKYKNHKILLPNATERPVSVNVTFGTYGSHKAGDCYQVKIPGQPAVTTSTADSDAGMTWLNYGLLAGSEHTIFGHQLGADSWIYIDPDGKPWRAQLVFDPVTRLGSVSFWPFGQLGESASGVVQTIPVDGSSTTITSSDLLWMIEDIKPQGDRIIVVLYLDQTQMDGTRTVYRELRALRASYVIAISGVPPSASVSIVAAEPYFYTYEAIEDVLTGTLRLFDIASDGNSYTNVDHPISDGLGGHVIEETRRAHLIWPPIGLFFDDAGSAQKVYAETWYARDTTGDAYMEKIDGEWEVGSSENYTHSWAMRLHMGSQVMDWNASGTYSRVSAPGDTSGVVTRTRVWRDYPDSVFGLPGELGWNDFAERVLLVKRAASRLYILLDTPRYNDYPPPDGIDTRRIGWMTPWAKNSAVVSYGDLGKPPWQVWGSVHPVTHEVVIDSAATCFC